MSSGRGPQPFVHDTILSPVPGSSLARMYFQGIYMLRAMGDSARLWPETANDILPRSRSNLVTLGRSTLI